MLRRCAHSLLLLLLLVSVMALRTEAKQTSAAAAANEVDDYVYADGGDDYLDDDSYDDDDYGGIRAVIGGGSSADDCDNNTVTTTTKKTGIAGNFGSLCTAFRTLRNVVPMKTLVRITQQHYRYDLRFRRALNFIQSYNFARASREIENTDAYQSMLLKFEAAGIDTSELHITLIFDCLLMPVVSLVQSQTPYYAVGDGPDFRERSFAIVPGARSLGSYTRDIWMVIPRNKFRNAIGKQLTINSEFANFYRTLNNVNFRRDVLRGLSSKSMKEATRTFRQNFINLRQLLSFVFRVFSLGPSTA